MPRRESSRCGAPVRRDGTRLRADRHRGEQRRDLPVRWGRNGIGRGISVASRLTPLDNAVRGDEKRCGSHYPCAPERARPTKDPGECHQSQRPGNRKNMCRGIIGSDFKRMAAQQKPLGRAGLPGDIAPVAMFLASDGARWVTGETSVRLRGTLTCCWRVAKLSSLAAAPALV
jgi:Enoyl-(Acyl carrier protein) reductase